MGDNVYSAIVRPDAATGDLRDPTSADWDAGGFSRSVAWDGSKWLEVERYFVAAHSAMVTWNEKALSTNFDNGNRWRGFFSGCSIHGASINDVIYDTNQHKFRRWTFDAVNMTNWCHDIPPSDPFWDELGSTVNHEYQNATDALANVTANDQWFIYQKANNGGFGLFETSGFSAAAGDHYEYRWREVLPTGLAHGELFVVGPDPLSGVLRDAGSADYNAATGNSRVLAFDGTDVVRAARRDGNPTPSSGTWTTVADGTALSSAFRWRGTHWQDYLVTAATPGDVYYNRTTGFRRRFAGRWEATSSATIFNAQGLEYLGAFNTTREATDHAIANGNYAVIVVGGVPTLQRISAFTPAAAAGYTYYWTPVSPPDHFPGPTTASADQLMRFNTTSAEWTAQDLVTGDSIDGIGTAGDPLVVNTHDVIETLTEHVRYFHGGVQNATDRGSTVCQVYITGPYQYGVTHIRVGIDAPATGAHYRGRLYTLADNNVITAKLADTPERAFSTGGQSHYLYFDSHGVVVEDNTRVAVCVSRTRVSADTQTRLYFGSEDSDSPEVSYPDADEDFDLRGWAQYTAVDPSVGTDTHAHDTDGNATIHGNIEIYYTRTVNHGHLVGDGNVDLDHLDSDVTARLLPGTVADNQIARYDSGTSAWVAEDLTATSCEVHTTYSTTATYTPCDSVILTQDQYDAIATPVAGVIYKIRAP